jgi:threonine synthase
MSFITHLECPNCKQSFSIEQVQSFCHDCHSPILARYDLTSAKETLDREEISNRPPGMWRWQDLLPVQNLSKISSLGEGDTPLISLDNLESIHGSKNVWIKDEGINPTGSFKARGLSAAVSKADEIGLKKLAIPTAGNAGSALAAYASRARMKSATVMPADTPKAIINECELYGAEVTLVDGLISDCAKIVSELSASGDWFSVSTFREPYRLEGKKTLGFEIAEQFDWKLPDNIIYPTGGGTGLVGMWKAFKELQALGWLENDHLPKMVSVQSVGCAPVVKAYNSGADHCEFWEDAKTFAGGIRVPISLADRLILEILRESGGSAIAVTDEDMQAAQKEMASHVGIFSSPEGAATFSALIKMFANGMIQPEESVVLFSTASGVKYL